MSRLTDVPFSMPKEPTTVASGTWVTSGVGTGGRFEVPPLVGVAMRPPYLHDGCGATLTAMLACGTRHGSIGALDETQRTDLITYLDSL